MRLSILKPKLCVSFAAAIILAVTTAVSAAAAADRNWPDGSKNCRSDTADFLRDCTQIYKYAARDTAAKSVMAVYRHAGKNFSKSELKAAYKLQNLKPEKWMLKNPENVKFAGLRSETGQVLLKTVYEAVYPLSETHSVVKLKNDEFKIAAHGSGQLTDIPGNYDKIEVLMSFDRTTQFNVYNVFLRKFPGDNSGLDVYTPLLTDLTLGASVSNVNMMRHSGYDVWGNGYALYVKNPVTGKTNAHYYDSWHNLLDDEAMMFGVNFGEVNGKTHALYEEAKSLVARVGAAPLGTGLRDESLYWPFDLSGKVMPRPENVAGIVPMSHRYIVYGDVHKKLFDTWVVVFYDGTDFDYALATFGNSSKASDIVENLDRFERLDDVYFEEGLNHGASFAILPKQDGASAPLWHAYRDTNKMGQDAFAVFKGYKFESEYRGASAASAIRDRDTETKRLMAEWSRQAAELDAKYEAARKAKKEADYRAWVASKNQPAPVQRSGSTYTLEQGFRDMGRAIYCTRREQKCISDGQYERCRMVTVDIC